MGDFCESQALDAFVQREIPRFCSFLAGDPAIESSGFAWIYWHSAGGSRSKLRIISLRLFYRHRRVHHALGCFRKFLLIQDHLFRGFRRTSFRNGDNPRFCIFSGWPKHCTFCTFWIWKHLLALADDYKHICFYSATILIIIEGVKFDLIVCLHVIWLKIIGSRKFCSKSFSSRGKEIVDRWSNSLQFSRGDLDKIIDYSETHDKNFIRFAPRSPGMQKIQNVWNTLDQLLVERIWWEV